MAIADTINSMKTNITNAYNAIQTKGGTVPTNKNLANLSTAINSISTGGGIEDVATVAALKAKVTAENVGKFYKYTGTSSDGFESNSLYQVIQDNPSGSNYYGALGLGKVSVNANKYTVTYNYTNCGDDFPVTNMPLGGIIKSEVYTMGEYVLPDTITVSGCQYTWDVFSSTKKNGALTLYNATGNITVTITAKSTVTLSENAIYKFFVEDMQFVPKSVDAAALYKLYVNANGNDSTAWNQFKTVMTDEVEWAFHADEDGEYAISIIKDSGIFEACGWTITDIKYNRAPDRLNITITKSIELIWYMYPEDM